MLLGAVVFLVWTFVDVHIQRSHQPSYYDPENDMERIVTAYLWVLGAGGLGCFLLWLGSFLGPKDSADLI